MRLPNGYGTVYKLSGNRRRPWMVRKFVQWRDDGSKEYQTLGYYEKQKDALAALAAYNANPYSIEASRATFREVFEKWSKLKYDKVSQSAINGYNAAFQTAEKLHDLRFVEIKTPHMQSIIQTCGKKYDTLRKIKVLFNQLFKFAMENDIVSKDYSKFIDLGKNEEESSRKPFTEQEIKRLFEVKDQIEYVDTILIMIYTGFRIGELLILKPEDVNLEERIITGGIKTDAGKNRAVPISDKIFDMIKCRVEQGNETLVLNRKGKPFRYDNYYREVFKPIMDQLLVKHKPHDCRHTFATMMSNAGADMKALQLIIGHASYETTANIYTHKDLEQLRKAIELI